jgi:hypothetical protein
MPRCGNADDLCPFLYADACVYDNITWGWALALRGMCEADSSSTLKTVGNARATSIEYITCQSSFFSRLSLPRVLCGLF